MITTAVAFMRVDEDAALITFTTAGQEIWESFIRLLLLPDTSECGGEHARKRTREPQEWLWAARWGLVRTAAMLVLIVVVSGGRRLVMVKSAATLFKIDGA
jgi:hypothetical protein